MKTEKSGVELGGPFGRLFVVEIDPAFRLLFGVLREGF